MALTAPGRFAMVKRTNRQGIATFRVKLTKPGILRLRVVRQPPVLHEQGTARAAVTSVTG